MATNDSQEYTVVMFDADDWHGISVERGWEQAMLVHRGAVNALRVIDHPHAERVKIIPCGADYSHEPLAATVRRAPAPTPAPAAPAFAPGQRVRVLDSDGATGVVVSQDGETVRDGWYAVSLDSTGQVLRFLASGLEPAPSAAPAQPTVDTLQRAINAMDQSLDALSVYFLDFGIHEAVMETLEAIRQAVHALARS